MRRATSKADSNLLTRNTWTRLHGAHDDEHLFFVLIPILADADSLVKGQCDYGGGLVVVSVLGVLSYHEHWLDQKKPYVKTPILGL